MTSGVVHHLLPRAFGRYLLLQRVAEGGMAEVYLALEEHPQAGRRFVTIKRIREEHVDDPDFVDFFITEGRVSLKFAHPNLPLVFELGCHDEVHYLAMEYIHGHNLLDLLRGAVRGRRPLSLSTVTAIGISVAAALEHAHCLADVDGAPLHLIHRDVTPQNIMLSTAGTVKLIDFGIVRSAIQVHRTQTGIIKGKFAYMAPEQLDGQHIDHRADLFALGIVLWEALLARPLFRGRTDEETVDNLQGLQIPDPRRLRADVPPALSAVVLKALERNPRRRFPSATEMLAALEQVAEHCHMVPSITRLRREAAELCGSPALPVLPAQDAAGDPAAGAGPTETGQAVDPLLTYYLRQAGIGAMPGRAADGS
ncbi:MAG TPA: serine/threonine-protein kinase [Kofleriaceae bacterium]|nr:serine/threonine-protein kinase [Kofleriaceae bacterium]